MFLEDSCERLRDAFDVGKDWKVASVCWLSPFQLRNIPTNSSGVGVGGGGLTFFLKTSAAIFMG